MVFQLRGLLLLHICISCWSLIFLVYWQQVGPVSILELDLKDRAVFGKS